MKITLRTFADFRNVIGATERELSLAEGETVGGMLRGLCKAHPCLETMLFDTSGEIKPYIIVLKNGRNVISLQQLGTTIDEGDVIALFPPVAGG
jgi:molybdopterin synthase sulfur carrier subunit